MTQKYFIIIAERNPRIQDYLSRELAGEGCHVFSVRTVIQLRNWISNHRPIDLLVLDPGFFKNDSGGDLEQILGQIPDVPVIFHCLPAEHPHVAHLRRRPVYVEKSGTSVIVLKLNIDSLFCNESEKTPPFLRIA